MINVLFLIQQVQKFNIILKSKKDHQILLIFTFSIYNYINVYDEI